MPLPTSNAATRRQQAGRTHADLWQPRISDLQGTKLWRPEAPEGFLDEHRKPLRRITAVFTDEWLTSADSERYEAAPGIAHRQRAASTRA